MDRSIRCFFILVFTLLVFGCEKWRDDPYFVRISEDGNEFTLNYDVGGGGSVRRIDGDVFAVGSNQNYVVVKNRLPNDHSIIHYYIIDRNKDGKFSEPLDAVIGPLPEAEYEIQKAKLMLPEFTNEF